MNRRKLIPAVLLTACGMAVVPSHGGENSITLRYRFPGGATLRYRIERQDSLLLPGDPGGQASVSFFRITQSIRPMKGKDPEGFRIALSTDSLWRGPESPHPVNQYEKMLFGSEFNDSEEQFEIDRSGISSAKRRRFIPFLIPLPGTAVTTDESWDFRVDTPFIKPFKGHIQTAGDCQVYRFLEEGGDSLALLAVEIEKSNSAEMSFKEPFQTLTNLYETSDSGVGALYFNISRGCMERGVIRWSGKVHALESGREKVYLRKSRLTFRLLPAP